MGWLVVALPEEQRAEVADRIQRSGALTRLLNLVFDAHLADQRRLPEDLATQLRQSEAAVAGGQPETSTGLQRLAGCVFAGLVQRLPAVVRYYWQYDCPRRLTQTVGEFTSTFVSPVLVERELARANGAVLESDTSVMSVTARFASRELMAEYTIDERKMELLIVPAPNHPLCNVKVQTGRNRVGVPAATWRTWTLQMVTFIANENGSLLDALRMWKRNVDKRFEGVEECAVCYAVVHGTNYSVPSAVCEPGSREREGGAGPSSSSPLWLASLEMQDVQEEVSFRLHLQVVQQQWTGHMPTVPLSLLDISPCIVDS